MLNRLLAEFRKELRTSAAQLKPNAANPRYDTSDIVQEGMVQIWTAIQDVGVENFSANKTYLRRISRGTACNLYRFHSAQCRAFQSEHNLPAEQLKGESEEPHDILAEEENVLRLFNAISELPTDRQRAFCRRIIDRVTFREIAEEMDCSIDVVRSLYKNAVSDLRRAVVEP